MPGSKRLRNWRILYQLGVGSQIVREAVRDAKRLAVYWLEESHRIKHPPFGNPDPGDLVTSSLTRVADHARKISNECVDLVLAANAALRNAHSELDKAYKTAQQQTFRSDTTLVIRYLEEADQLLNKVLALPALKVD